jgi:spermidine synthase
MQGRFGIGCKCPSRASLARRAGGILLRNFAPGPAWTLQETGTTQTTHPGDHDQEMSPTMSLETIEQTAALEPSAPPRGGYVDLFLISFVVLFFELACIRWFGSMVIFLTFFTNIVLMACFLGMSVGCLAASRRTDFIRTVIPLALVTAALACGTIWAYNRFGTIVVDLGSQKSPQQIFFGTEYRAKDPGRFIVPIELVAGAFFALIALTFVGLGQVLGRAFNAIPNRVASYTINILGSLFGIAAFGLASYYRTAPLVWFAVSVGLILYFVRPLSLAQVACQVALLALVGYMSFNNAKLTQPVGRQFFWSPYYKIEYTQKDALISTNNIGHQSMVKVEEAGPAYMLPHLLNRDAGGRPFEDVLIIGAGSGNDVQAALMNGAKHIDAVEIDPVINEIGRSDHPDRPYDDPRVTIHLDDGRSFVRKTDRKYDLVVYALVDSLVLHSGYSSLRLESFLFTEQAFRDIKARLKPGGVFAMYNVYRQGWVVGRLKKMGEDAFGTEPLVISLPYQAEVAPTDNQASHYNFLLVSNTDDSPVGAIRKALAERKSFWLNKVPRLNLAVNAYGAEPPSGAKVEATAVEVDGWNKIAPAAVDTKRVALVPTDDWPSLYLREATIPGLNLRGMAVVAAVSLAILLAFAPVRTARPNGQMFFLGAGFMLLETKGVVHMALLFGSTWVINSIVFFAILVMVLLSNLYVLIARPRRMGPYYALLIASLLVNTLVPMEYFLSLPGASRVIVSCAIIFVPIFFAGVIFAAAFRDSRQPDVDFGSNIGGVILGGLSEYFSLMVGFKYLLFIAIAFYLLSALLRPRAQAVPAMSG